jgi:hypothetical protein
MAMIVDMLLEEIRSVLQTALIDNIPEDDPARPDIVKVGRFLENPKKKNIHVAVTGGDPDKPDHQDRIVGSKEDNSVRFEVSPREIGGGEAWWRTGTVYFGVYMLNNAKEDDARTAAYTLYGRIQQALKDMHVTHLTDEFNEHAFKMLVNGTEIAPTGGNGKWIWRGEVRWQCLTWRE